MLTRDSSGGGTLSRTLTFSQGLFVRQASTTHVIHRLHFGSMAEAMLPENSPATNMLDRTYHSLTCKAMPPLENWGPPPREFETPATGLTMSWYLRRRERGKGDTPVSLPNLRAQPSVPPTGQGAGLSHTRQMLLKTKTLEGSGPPQRQI